MSKANDLEGLQDMGRKYGGHAGMPKPDRSAAQQGIVLDEKAGTASRKIPAPSPEVNLMFNHLDD
jgi:hypothetical protein